MAYTYTKTANGMTTTYKPASGWSNVANVLNPLSGGVKVGSGDSPILNTIATAAKYVGLVGSAAYVATKIPVIATAIKPAGTAAAVTTATTGTTLKYAAFGLGAGALASSLLSGGGGGSSGQQTSNQQPKQEAKITPEQPTNQNPNTNPNQQGDNTTQGGSGNYNYLYQNRYQTQNTESYYSAFAQPTQTLPTTFAQTTSQEPTQTTTASGGTNWLLIAAVGLGAYMLAGNK